MPTQLKQLNDPQRQRLEVAVLRPHPLQPHYCDAASAEDDRALAADLRDHGQRDPVHVLPPGNKAGLPAYTILDGHRRAEALQANGQTEVDVRVRHDLADADAAAVEAEFLRFNFSRRQLHPIDKARVALRLYEIERGRPPGQLKSWEQSEARDRVGRMIGMSGRNLQRYFRLLQAPAEVQRAVRDGRLPLVAGAKVCGLSERYQAEITRRIRGGEPAGAVVRECLGDGPGVRPNDALATLVRNLNRSLPAVEGWVDEIAQHMIEHCRPTLTQAQDVIRRLLRRR